MKNPFITINIPNHEGYIAFCNKMPLNTESNPYDFIEEQEAHLDWIDGWREAQEDINKRWRRRELFKAFWNITLPFCALLIILIFTFW